jgi:serine/threonine protein kinase
MMAVDRWNLIEEIFHGALERPLAERQEYVLSACGDDSELRLEVESLLANDREAAGTVGSLVVSDLRTIIMEPAVAATGTRVGPYKLVRELDSGGMGVVYLAVRSDDQYFQIVAMKMIRKGIESPALLQRFRTERQVLATLSHPNIGTILDGGETSDGRPFIVMEFVEGQSITQACENLGLSIRRRIELFRSLCSAVHYAHQKLVIHRDIKPSNVLVTSDGAVKLIDFGISKPISAGLISGGSSSAATTGLVLTPDYASPEQLSGLELTTSTDIYSLGVLLYELLTGSRPYTLSGLSYAAALKLVCSGETPKPSAIPELSDKSRKELTGDLDRIILMAMEKDPSRRYQSAQHLNEDLLRYLEGKPVLARKATPLYRLGKFVQRHRTASLLTCAMVVMIGASILLYFWQSRRAERRVNQIESLADSTISDMTEKLQDSSASVETQAALFQGAIQYLDQLRQSSRNDPRILLQLSKAYRRLGNLEGSPFVANLGNRGVAVASFQAALQSALAAQARLPGAESTTAVIIAYHQLGQFETFAGDLEQARDHYQRCLALAGEFVREKPDDPLRKQLLAASYAGLGYVEYSNLQADKAVQNDRAAVQAAGDQPTGKEADDRRLTALYARLGRDLNELGSNTEALAIYTKTIPIAEDLARKYPSDQNKRNVFVLYNNIVDFLAGIETLNAGQTDQAQVYARKTLKIAEELAASDSKNVQARSDLAYAFVDMGNSLRSARPSEAAAWYRKSIELTRRLGSGMDTQLELAGRDEALASGLTTRTQAPERLHLLQEANAIRQAIARNGPNPPHDRVHLMRSYCRLSDAELAMRDPAHAGEYADSSLPFIKEFNVKSPSLLVLRDLGFCYQSLGNVQGRLAMDSSLPSVDRNAAATKAQEWYGKSLEIWNEWDRRGAATPESDLERHKLEHLVKITQ